MVGSEVQRHLHCKRNKADASLLDLYSGCGAMSTGLCLGAQFTGVNLETRWAVDVNESACESLKFNHPGTQVRNETAEDFLDLLKAWEKLCKKYSVNSVSQQRKSTRGFSSMNDRKINSHGDKIPAGEYDVLKLVDICYGDPCEVGKRGLRFKVLADMYMFWESDPSNRFGSDSAYDSRSMQQALCQQEMLHKIISEQPFGGQAQQPARPLLDSQASGPANQVPVPLLQGAWESAHSEQIDRSCACSAVPKGAALIEQVEKLAHFYQEA
ncbi:hypothetical protein ACLOJK_030268 [Asimina triloba]